MDAAQAVEGGHPILGIDLPVCVVVIGHTPTGPDLRVGHVISVSRRFVGTCPRIVMEVALAADEDTETATMKDMLERIDAVAKGRDPLSNISGENE